MKKLTIIILLLISSNMFAQTKLIGIKGGISHANIIEDRLYARMPRTGFSLGLSYYYLLKKTFSFGADLVYNQCGYKEAFEAWDVSTLNSRYNYISLPLKIGIYGGNKLFCFANGGIVPSVLISAKEVHNVYYIGRNEDNTSITTNITKSTNKVDLAGLFELGLGYRFRKKYWVYSSFTYQSSYTPISKSIINGTQEYKQFSKTLSLGIKYALKN